MKNPIIVDLGFGDAGKGTTVDYLADDRSVVVRYNGGPQCAHNVVLPDGRHHTFAQFGSGTFRGARTHLSRFMLVNPISMMHEADGLERLGFRWTLKRTTVDPRVQIITRFHVAANRIKELSRGAKRHGSTGHGLGEARADALAGNDVLRVQDIGPNLGYMLEQTRIRMMAEVLPLLDYWTTDEGQQSFDGSTVEAEWAVLNNQDLSVYTDAYTDWRGLVELRYDDWLTELDGRLIFEGGQGVLLDETHGFAPHVTWTDTTSRNALTLLRDAGLIGTVVGVTRTYMTRHGAGPLPTEDGHDRPEAHNDTGRYQGSWRTGYLDVDLLRYAVAVSPIDRLVITHMDCLKPLNKVLVKRRFVDGKQFHGLPGDVDYMCVEDRWHAFDFADSLACELDAVIAFESHGPTRDDKKQPVFA